MAARQRFGGVSSRSKRLACTHRCLSSKSRVGREQLRGGRCEWQSEARARREAGRGAGGRAGGGGEGGWSAGSRVGGPGAFGRGSREAGRGGGRVSFGSSAGRAEDCRALGKTPLGGWLEGAPPFWGLHRKAVRLGGAGTACVEGEHRSVVQGESKRAWWQAGSAPAKGCLCLCVCVCVGAEMG